MLRSLSDDAVDWYLTLMSCSLHCVCNILCVCVCLCIYILSVFVLVSVCMQHVIWVWVCKSLLIVLHSKKKLHCLERKRIMFQMTKCHKEIKMQKGKELRPYVLVWKNSFTSTCCFLPLSDHCQNVNHSVTLDGCEKEEEEEKKREKKKLLVCLSEADSCTMKEPDSQGKRWAVRG